MTSRRAKEAQGGKQKKIIGEETEKKGRLRIWKIIRQRRRR
jgi:hypothetical protein